VTIIDGYEERTYPASLVGRNELRKDDSNTWSSEHGCGWRHEPEWSVTHVDISERGDHLLCVLGTRRVKVVATVRKQGGRST
jgi:hypothetical protein